MSAAAATTKANGTTTHQLHLVLAKRDATYDELLASLPQAAERLATNEVLADTEDQEDHTFCGIMFAMEALDKLPMLFVEIQALSVRGRLGRVSVFFTEKHFQDKFENASAWRRVFGPTNLRPSRTEFVELPFTSPVRLAPGMTGSFYVHSEALGDEAIVYSNQHSPITYEDDSIRIYPGMAHVSNVAFNRFGDWGIAWRPRRAFVGRVRYGVKRLLWRPDVHFRFPNSFKTAVKTMLLCQMRSKDSPEARMLARIPTHVLFKIMQYCTHAWFVVPGLGDDDMGDGEAEAEARRAMEAEDEEVNRALAWGRWGGLFRPFAAALGGGGGVAAALAGVGGADDDEDEEWEPEEGDDEGDGDDERGDDEDDQDDDDDDDDDGGGGEGGGRGATTAAAAASSAAATGRFLRSGHQW